MLLRGHEFGYCWDQSGVRNFFGEGYPYHRYLKPIGLRFRGSTFVTKTTTIDARPGNMPMKADKVTPREFIPKCIAVDFRGGYALNAVALSGPGAQFLLETGKWQERTEPFIISFMSTAITKDSRMVELRMFVDLLKEHLPNFKACVALQINFTCPNVGVHHVDDQMADEVIEALAIASVLNIPLIPKINIETSIDTAIRIANDRNCDAITLSNTVKWGNLPDKIDWKSLFDKTGVSPLADLGGGGLSGKPLFPLVCEWLYAARDAGIRKPLNVGGGILGPRDVVKLVELGASSVALGSIAFLRPWRMQSTISRVNELAYASQFYEPTH